MKKYKSIFVKSIHHRVPDKKINLVKCITWLVVIGGSVGVVCVWIVALRRF